MVEEKVTEKRSKPLAAALAIVVIAAVAVALLVVASNIVRPKDNSPEAGIVDERAYGLLGEPQDSLDVVFLGDSEAASTFSSLQMWHEHGFASYVCSTDGQQLMYTNSLLRLALRNQSPKVVVFEANAFYAEFSVGDVLLRTLEDALPVFEYHDRWKRLTPEDFYAPVRATWVDELKGYKLLGGGVAANAEAYMAPDESVAELPTLNRMFVEMMVNYCREHGATPVFVSVPSTDSWTSAKHNGTAMLAAEMGVDFVDLNCGSEKIDVDWSSETFDGVHLSVDASSRATKAYGALLASTYDLPDHRGEEPYATWDEAYGRYVQAVRDVPPAA